jgi:hypothetical protein
VEPILTTPKERSFPFSSVMHGMQGFARLRFTQPEFGPDFPSLTRGCLFIPLTFRLSLYVSTYSTVRQPYLTYRPATAARLHRLAESIPWKFGIDRHATYVAWRAGTTTAFLAPIDCSKIPALGSLNVHKFGRVLKRQPKKIEN